MGPHIHVLKPLSEFRRASICSSCANHNHEPVRMEQMCDPAQVSLRRPFHATGRSICAATALPTTSGIECFDVVLGTSFTVTLSEDPVAIWAGFGFVCWTDQEGTASCSDGASVPSVRVADVQRLDQRFSLLNDSGFVSQSAAAPLPFSFPSESGNILAVGPNLACVVLPSSASSFSCFVSVTDPAIDASSITTNPTGFFGSPITDFRINTTTIWWTNEALSLSYFGVPGCEGNPYCTSASGGDMTIFTIPPGLEALRVSPGYQQVCAVTPDHSLTCWGSFSTISGWETLSSVMDVFVYNTGGCAVFESFSSATCWGSLSRTFPLLYRQCAPCTVTSSLIFNDACLPCEFGFESSVSTLSVSAWCVPCPPVSVRGPTDSVCILCGDGSETNASLTECVACLPSEYRSLSMASCSECGPGSQSVAGGSSCTSCSLPLFRSLSMVSCSACPSGSLPNTSQTECLACPLPQYCSGSTLLFSSCTCVLCDEGTQVSGFGCASCTAPFIRLNPSQTCYRCPEGTEPNSSFTLCLPCTGNFVRTNPSPYCFACPTNTRPNASHTRCDSVFRPFRIEAIQYVLVGSGLLLFLIAWALASFNPVWASTAAIFGVLCIGFGAAYSATVDKPNPS